MDLRCKLGHMRGGRVLVNGTSYPVDPSGVVKADGRDAAKLLSCGWVMADGSTPPELPKAAPVVVPDLRPTIGAPPEHADRKIEVLPGDPWPPDDEDAEDPEGSPAAPEVQAPADAIPEPSMKMSRAQLRELADRYSVPWTEETTKRQLVNALEAAMYEEVEVIEPPAAAAAGK